MARKRRQRITQLSIFPRGGAREGAGRKPKGLHAMVAHTKRARVTRHDPMLVTTKLVRGLPSLRSIGLLPLLREVLSAGSDRFGFRLVEYSIQSNHVHFLVEAPDRTALGRGMKGLLVRVAKALNRAWQRRGRVLLDRDHARVLKSPRDVSNVLIYVLHNARKHGAQILGVDAHSSDAWFAGWSDRAPRPDRPLPAADSWLLESGWSRAGAISTSDRPRGGVEWDPWWLEPDEGSLAIASVPRR